MQDYHEFDIPLRLVLCPFHPTGAATHHRRGGAVLTARARGPGLRMEREGDPLGSHGAMAGGGWKEYLMIPSF